MTYFHTGIRTIIGADSFHCPVRDGKEWGQLAMVVRQTVRLAALDCSRPCLLLLELALQQARETVLGRSKFWVFRLHCVTR